MSPTYNKYLEYLGHVDDTTREDMLAREAKIQKQIEILKKKNKEVLRIIEAQCEQRLAEAYDALGLEKEKYAQELSEMQAKYNSAIESLKQEILTEKRRGEKTLADKETELNVIIDSLKSESEKAKFNFRDELKNKIAELEKKHHQNILEKDGEIKILKKEIKKQKSLCVKNEADIRGYYEQMIRDIKQKSQSRGFWRQIGDAFKYLFNKWTSFFKAVIAGLCSFFRLIARKSVPNREDFKDNLFGAIGYVMSLVGLIICWAPFVPWGYFPLSLILSVLGVIKKPRYKAICGIILTGLNVFFTFLIWENLYDYL